VRAAVSTEFTHRTLLAARPERIVELLTDPAAVTERYAAAGFTGVAVTRHADGESLVVESERDETGTLPGPLAKITGGSVHLRQTDTWSATGPGGQRTAAWRIGFRGVPGSIEGTIEVAPEGSGAVLVHRATVSAGIPLIGRRIEALTIDQTIAKLDAEGRWLIAHV
jgi:hypothetical protein